MVIVMAMAMTPNLAAARQALSTTVSQIPSVIQINTLGKLECIIPKYKYLKPP